MTSKTKLTSRTESGSPYCLDEAQVHRASEALLKHIRSSADDGKRNLLAEDTEGSGESQAIWLIFTTKKHIVPQKRLKPCKITLPHSLNTSPSLSICIITPDPQRAFKDVIHGPAFPASLSKRVERIIDIKKLEKKFHSFESKRALLDSHDVFYADDRIVTYLSKLLGKTFYSHTNKRPVPIHLEAYQDKAKKSAALPSTKSKKNEEPRTRSVGTATAIAKEIEKTMSMTLVNLSPSVTTSVRIGLSSQAPKEVATNIISTTQQVVDKYVPRQWRGIKAIHVKGPNSMALPIWLADELWDDDEMIVADEQPSANQGAPAENGKTDRRNKKRKAAEADFSEEMKARREKLRQQKSKHQAEMA